MFPESSFSFASVLEYVANWMTRDIVESKEFEFIPTNPGISSIKESGQILTFNFPTERQRQQVSLDLAASACYATPPVQEMSKDSYAFSILKMKESILYPSQALAPDFQIQSSADLEEEHNQGYCAWLDSVENALSCTEIPSWMKIFCRSSSKIAIKENDGPSTTKEELRCLLDNLLKNSKGHTNFKPEDKEKLLEEYKQYLVNKERYLHIQNSQKKEQIEAPLRLIAHNIFAKQVKIFITNFVHTLLEAYVKRYLKNQGHSDQRISWEISIAKSSLVGLMLWLNSSAALAQVLIDATINKAIDSSIQSILRNIPALENTYIIAIATAISSVVALIEKPATLLDWVISGNAALAGQAAAYKVIKYMLPTLESPKVKIEERQTPVPTQGLSTQDMLRQRRLAGY